jgi:hypothetical protein
MTPNITSRIALTVPNVDGEPPLRAGVGEVVARHPARKAALTGCA